MSMGGGESLQCLNELMQNIAHKCKDPGHEAETVNSS